MFPRRFLTTILLVGALAAVACGSPPSAGCTGTEVVLREEGTLRVGIDLDYAPFAFNDAEGISTGFEVELLREVAEHLGLDLLLVPRGDAALVPGVLAHSHDLAAAGLRNDPDLVREVCASTPYLEAGLGVLLPVPDPRDIGGTRDLAGRTVAVRQGSLAESWLRENLRAAAVEAVPASEDVLVALERRTADAAIDDLAWARFVAERNQGFTLVDRIDLDRSYVFVMASDNGGLAAEVNRALEALADDGTLDSLRSEWFGS